MAQVHFLLKNANRVTQPFLVFPGQEFNLKVVARHFNVLPSACTHATGCPSPPTPVLTSWTIWQACWGARGQLRILL